MNDAAKNAMLLDQLLNADAGKSMPLAETKSADPQPEHRSALRKMSKLPLVVAALYALTGCSTVMNDRIQDVSVMSEPAGQRYTITDEDGKRVATGVTPATVTLDAAAGFFDGQTYQVAYENGPTVELDSHTTGWYWVGFCITVFSGLVVDPITGDMFTLPDDVSNVKPL